jgi:hypothetical protein
MNRLACSGLAISNTGIGVVQKYLYPLLEADFGNLIFSPRRDLGLAPTRRLLGLINGFRPPIGKYEVYLSVVPPLPFGLRGRVVSIVHDLRWMRTRGALGRRYRMWDLKRTISRSDAIICISQRTYNDLVTAVPEAEAIAHVSWLGPGLVPEGSFVNASSGNLLLVGGAAHKANEQAAALLADTKPAWLKSVTGIGVSQVVKDTIQSAFGEEFGTWLENVDDTSVVAAFREAEFFMLLGQDEGFGLPFVEALASGCQVIALDQPLTREIFGDSCTYLTGDSVRNGRVLQNRPDIPADLRLDAVERFAWTKFGNSVASQLFPSRVTG